MRIKSMALFVLLILLAVACAPAEPAEQISSQTTGPEIVVYRSPL